MSDDSKWGQDLAVLLNARLMPTTFLLYFTIPPTHTTTPLTVLRE